MYLFSLTIPGTGLIIKLYRMTCVYIFYGGEGMSNQVHEDETSRSSKLNLRSRIFKQLEQDIVNGVYPPGANLTEKALSEKLGVSRTPLREALCQLELQGLVDSIPNKGVVVVGVSKKDIEDIYVIKYAIEALAARLAAERITPEEVTELEEVINLTEFYANKGNVEKIVDLDSRFHDLIAKAGKNRPLRSMMANFHNFVKMARLKSLTSPGRLQGVLKEHRALLDAIIAGTPISPRRWPISIPAVPKPALRRRLEGIKTILKRHFNGI